MPDLAIPAEATRRSHEQPQPGSLLKVSGVLFIVGCLAAGGFGLSLVLARPDYCSLVGGLLLVVWPLWFAQLEFRGTFRSDFAAARLINYWWLAFAAFLAVQLPAGTLVSMQQWQRSPIPYFVMVTLLIVFTGGGHLLRRHWVRELCFSINDAAQLQPSKAAWKFTLREMFLLMAAAAVLFGVCSSCLRFWSAGFAENVRPEQCPFELPVGASNVSYYAAGQRRAFEFTIDETGFEKWAAGLDLYEMRLPRGYYEMRRYGSLHPTLGRNNSVDISKGWYAEGYVDGRQTMIAYDQETGRAYYYRP